MWTGVDRGFAKFRFSTSPRRSGFDEIMMIRIVLTSGTGSMSLMV